MLADGTGWQVADAYSKLLSSQPAAVCGKANGLPSVDLALLGTGDDGHCASIYPDSGTSPRA